MLSSKNWSLRRKMYLQFIGAVLPLVVVTWYEQRSTSELPAQVNQALQAYNLTLDAADHYRLFLNGIADAVDAEKSALGSQAITEMGVVAERLQALVSLDQAHTEDNNKMVVTLGRIRTVALRPDSIKALMPLKADINTVKKSLDESAGNYKARLEQLSAQINEQQSREAGRQRLLAGITMATLLMLAFIVRRGVNNVAIPVAMAVETARRVAQGNLTGHIAVRDGGDELNELQRSLRDMNRSLTDIVGEVRGVSQDISGRTQTIAQGNQELATRMHAQADQLAATAARVQSLLKAVARNAASSKEASQLARGAASVAGKGGHMVEQVTRTMTSIQHSSEQVVNIIGIIEDIAFQTNLLALNAAVEAARAGEQGQGFAVVASEVRNLAQRSAATAKQIRDIIGNSVDNVKAGAELVVSTGNTMRELVGAVSRVATVIADIEDASRQQNTEAEQVNHSIADVENMTVQNTELINETVFMADSMLARTAQLMAAVSKFKLYRHWRLQVPWHARLSSTTGIANGMVKNLSAVGALVETEAVFKLGDKCWLAMINTVSGHGEVLVGCEVVRVSDAGGEASNYGLHFLKIRRQDKQALGHQLKDLLAQQSTAGITNDDVTGSMDAFERLPVVNDDEVKHLFEFQSLVNTASAQMPALKAASM